jgi:uncharacterized membrane protein YqiK
MKKPGFLIPILLIGIVLVLILLHAGNHNVFKRTPEETLQMSKGGLNIIGPDALASMQNGEFMIIEIGMEKVLPSFPSKIQIKSIEFNQLLSKETRTILANNKVKKVLFAENITDAVKSWTFLTRLGYSELYILDPDYKNSMGQKDSILKGNEELHYTLK